MWSNARQGTAALYKHGTKPQLKAGYMALHQSKQDLQGKFTWSSKGKEIVKTVTETHDKECDCRPLIVDVKASNTGTTGLPQEEMKAFKCLMSSCSFSYFFCWMTSFSLTVLVYVSKFPV